MQSWLIPWLSCFSEEFIPAWGFGVPLPSLMDNATCFKMLFQHPFLWSERISQKLCPDLITAVLIFSVFLYWSQDQVLLSCFWWSGYATIVLHHSYFRSLWYIGEMNSLQPPHLLLFLKFQHLGSFSEVE